MPGPAIADLLRAYRAGTSDPVAALEHCLGRIAALNPRLNALVAPDPTARAQAEASAARWRDGAPCGQLDGVPCTVKDNIPQAGLPASFGSAVYRAEVCARDETAVARLRAAGAVLLGKTNVPEFCLEGFTANEAFGVTRNPWNPQLTPGGSSGGAVAGVAAGMWPAAIGTDGGGSIRRPAGHTGLVGLKPTLGRVARVHHLPQLLLDMEVVGPIARTVGDAAALFAAIEGPDPADPRSHLPAEPAADAAVDSAPSALRVLYVERIGAAPLAPEIAASVRHVADDLADLGHDVRQGPLPLPVERLGDLWPRIGESALAALKARLGRRFDAAAAPYRAMAEAGERLPAGVLYKVLETIAETRVAAAALFAETDIVLLPATAAQPWPAAERFPTTIDGVAVGPRGHAVYTGWVNAAGHPAIAIPAPPAPDGMPVGAQLVGAWNRDWQLLRLAHALERRRPWADRWPAMAA
ncbi:MAG: amidase [Alphaproteobacteria bacterium]